MGVRFVLDTAVLVAAIRSDAGASRQLLRLGLLGSYSMLVSVPLIIEYEAVMTRLEHLTAARLTEADVGNLLDAILSVAEPVQLDFLWRPALRDPNDDMVLEAAINGHADRLVTFNVKDFGGAAEQFGVVACPPRDAIKLLGDR